MYRLITLAAVALLLPGIGHAATPRFKNVVFATLGTDLAEFERFAARAKKSGATHINVSTDLPWSFWQYDTPGDPYPSWVISNPGLLKISIPKALASYLPHDYSEKVLAIVEARGRILRRLGLKASFNTFEPQMLPESVFTDHPLWRGARVDHPARSRVARFAPTIDNPEVLALYRESAAALLRRCPEIEMLSLATNDSGTGLDWSGGLYSGRFGNTLYQNRPMDERLRSFFTALQEGARDAGGSLEIDITMTRESQPARIAAHLRAGMAIENLEGPDATPYKAIAGARGAFYPVVGIPHPVEFVEGLERAAHSTAPRLVVSLGDPVNQDLYFDIYDRFWKTEIGDAAAKLAFLKQVAEARVGPQQAGNLLTLWLHLQDANRYVRLLDSGGTIFYLGCVQQRWITRPFVPFPSELGAAEKEYYRKFQFQARTEEDAENLVDLQASDIYNGWSGRYHAGRILREIETNIAAASRLAQGMKSESFADLDKRLQVLTCVIRTSRNAVSYQAQLDRARQLGLKPEAHPVGGMQSGWDRQLMLETARSEIDNTAVLMQLLRSNPGALLHLAATPAEEDIRVLGPNVVEQLQKKLNTMNAHWEDYNRIFTIPNL